MKQKIFLSIFTLLVSLSVYSQEADSTGTSTPRYNDKRPVKDAFESNWLINSHTMIVPTAKTLEFDINHRFGVVKNKFKDMYGLYAPSNIRLGLSYTPVKNVQIGAGMTKEDMMYDFNVKWNLLQQTRSGSSPIFITYFGNMVINGTENGLLFKNSDGTDYNKFPKYSHRFSYFHQLIIGRKFSDRISLQISPSFIHYNLIDTAAYKDIKFDNIAIGLGGRVKVTDVMSVIFEYYYPLTPGKDVKPNLALGIEAATGSHAFQFFLSPYSSIISQKDIVYNKNNFTKKEFAIGFNITRLWNF